MTQIRKRIPKLFGREQLNEMGYQNGGFEIPEEEDYSVATKNELLNTIKVP